MLDRGGYSPGIREAWKRKILPGTAKNSTKSDPQKVKVKNQ